MDTDMDMDMDVDVALNIDIDTEAPIHHPSPSAPSGLSRLLPWLSARKVCSQ